MLIEQWCTLWRALRCTSQDERSSRVLQRASFRMLNGVPDLTGLKLCITHHIRHGIDGASQQSCRLRLGDGLPFRALFEPCRIGPLDLGDEFVSTVPGGSMRRGCSSTPAWPIKRRRRGNRLPAPMMLT